MRLLFLLILIIGASVGIAYPWAIQNFSGKEIGTWRVFQRLDGFKTAQAELDASDAPVRVFLDMTSTGTQTFGPDRTVLTLTAATQGRTVLAETVTFATSTPRTDSPQSGEQLYRDEAGLIRDIDAGSYTFTVGPGDADGIDMKYVDLTLRSGAGEYDARAQPVGFVLMAVGFIGFVLALRRGGDRPDNPNSQPRAPRWGRGAGER